MKNTINFFLLGTAVIFMFGCQAEVDQFDVTGTFEATEIIVSSEATGKIMIFEAEEGAILKQGQSVAVIDALNLELQKAQVEASMDAVSQKQNDPGPQIRVLEEQIQSAHAQVVTLEAQLDVLEIEQARVENLLKAEAATQRQMDDINGKVRILNKQIAAAETQEVVLNAQIRAARQSVAIQNRGITSEKNPLSKQVAFIDNQIDKARVISPVNGTLLTKYAEAGEFTAIGKPMFKVADLSQIILRAYITGDQLGQIRLGQQVEVFIDESKEDYKKYTGEITWVSDKAEFTPKTIQTKNERANLVYAIKIAVPNDGYLKIGMYGEVRFKGE
ncbi:MAG: HlyD family efflux transporter periplasmic adaptor subunit [Saprospiraceae bacterium]|nr:HlyD family efflux transporter periplasmic adaptor subunit [Saprospiraceae bacterium]